MSDQRRLGRDYIFGDVYINGDRHFELWYNDYNTVLQEMYNLLSKEFDSLKITYGEFVLYAYNNSSGHLDSRYDY